jgi:hypothetical protein
MHDRSRIDFGDPVQTDGFEFRFGFKANMPQKSAGHFTEECLRPCGVAA